MGREWAKEGEKVDWQKLLAPRGFQVLPRRWVVERSLAWICHNRRMSKEDYERLCASGEAFVYAGDESPDGKAIGSPLRAFHTVSEEVFSEIGLPVMQFFGNSEA